MDKMTENNSTNNSKTGSIVNIDDKTKCLNDRTLDITRKKT